MDERNGGGVNTSLLDFVASFFLSEDVFYVVVINGFLSAQFSRFEEKREKKAKKKNDFDDDTKIIPRF